MAKRWLKLLVSGQWVTLTVTGLTIGVGITAYFSYQTIRGLILDLLKENAVAQVKNQGHKVDDWLGRAKVRLDALASTETVKTLDSAVVLPYLRSEISRFDDITGAGFAGLDGFIYSTNGQTAYIKDRAYFQRAVSGQINVSDPLVSRINDQKSVVVAAPVWSTSEKNRPDRRVIGKISAVVRIDALLKEFQQLGYGQGSYPFAINSKGEVIIHPNPQISSNPDGDPANLLSSTDPGLAQVADRMISRQAGIGLFPVDGILQYVVFLPLEEVEWSIALVIPRANIEGRLLPLDLLATLVASLSVLIAVLLWQVQTSKRRQLERLNEELEQRVADRTATLSSTLEELEGSRQQLQQANDELEQRVSDRTSELSSALQRLEQSQLHVIQSEKMSALGNLVAGIAHEINNPLGFLAGNLRQLKSSINDLITHLELYRNHSSREEITQHAEEIDLDYTLDDLPQMLSSMQLGCDRIQGISNSLRTFSRADSSHKVLANLHEGLDSTLVILQYRLKAKGHRPAIQVEKQYGDIPPVSCHFGQLNQVFMNILSNAIDAFEESNQGKSFMEIEANPNCITIATGMTEDGVYITIKDNGPGIPAEIQDRIFDNLFTTKEVGLGTGLGLSISKQIVEEGHGGKLICNSTPGMGAAFTISLPLTPTS